MVALPYLSQNGGALIETSSSKGNRSALPERLCLVQTWDAGFLDVLRMEVKHERIPVSITNIMPSGTNTPFFNHARSKLGVKPAPHYPVYQPRRSFAVLHARNIRG